MVNAWFILGKVIISIVAIATLLGGLLADFFIPVTDS